MFWAWLDALPKNGITTEPITIAAGQADVLLRLDNTVPPTESLTFKFRATGRMPDETLIITEDQVTVHPRK